MATSTGSGAPRQSSASEAPRFLPLETVSVRLGGRSPADRPVFGILSNISETGACIITNRPVPIGERVSLELECRRWSGKIVIEAVVVWSAERMEPVKEIVGFLTGLKFDPHGIETIRERSKSGIFQPVP